MEKYSSKFNCTAKCIPFFLSFLKHLPPCETFEDTQCMFYEWSRSFHDFKKCLKPKKTVLYETNVVNLEGSIQSRNSVEIDFSFSSDEMEVKEETLMIGPSSFIGSIGGSLGLFLDFSFYTVSWISCLQIVQRNDQ